MEPPAKRKNVVDDQPFTIGRGAQVVLSPDGKWVMQHFSKLYQQEPCPEAGKFRNVYISTVQGKESAIFRTKLHSITSGAWSPDSRRLAFGGEGKVYIYIPGLGRRRIKIRVPNGRVHQVWWSSDVLLKVATKHGFISTYKIIFDHYVGLQSIEHIPISRGAPALAFGDGVAAAASFDKEKQVLTIQMKTNHSKHTFSSPDLSLLNHLALSHSGQTVVVTSPEGLFVLDPRKDTPFVLNEGFEACGLCAVSPSGNAFVFTSRNEIMGVVNDSVVHDLTFDPGFKFTDVYFTSEKTYVVVLHEWDGALTKVARQTLP